MRLVLFTALVVADGGGDTGFDKAPQPMRRTEAGMQLLCLFEPPNS